MLQQIGLIQSNMRIQGNIQQFNNQHELQIIQQKIQNNSQVLVQSEFSQAHQNNQNIQFQFTQGHQNAEFQMNEIPISVARFYYSPQQFQAQLNSRDEPFDQSHRTVILQPQPQVQNQIQLQLAAQNHQIFHQLNNQLDHQILIPNITIPKYKYCAELFILTVGLVEIFFRTYTFIHVMWMVWFVAVGGFKRHVVRNQQQVKFFGELGNFLLWILSNAYIFAGHSTTPITVLPILVVLQNFDYYFSGSSLVLSYFYFTVFACCRCFANIKLRQIQKKLKNRRKMLIEKMLNEFEKNQILQNDNNTHNQRLSFDHNQDDHNTCSICLSQLKKQTNCSMFSSNIKQTSDRQRISTIDSSSNNKVLLLNCKHRFHTQCIKQWIVMDNMKCPICRRSI